eukprot:UN00278
MKISELINTCTKTTGVDDEKSKQDRQEFEKKFDINNNQYEPEPEPESENESECEQMATLTCNMLKELKPLEQKRAIGERLYPKILMLNIEQKLAGKVMVVLLSMDNDKLLKLLLEQKTFTDAINQAIDMLKKQKLQNVVYTELIIMISIV